MIALGEVEAKLLVIEPLMVGTIIPNDNVAADDAQTQTQPAIDGTASD